ncbi:hypothetical protein BC939DRAFT_459634 [Gamsiella multidivaricata]|uniref:uncharacterized protein n=1 Tax=Gamsiella multidivaricata TaxID=101098 RepID=UPI00222027D6|nr:uncharacterized protein BC939DRAFT_459634 [Gamsiella multidivaricata]KAI7819569.1 hypothetical protein BC939DRAFT_459634 [Gamsiella multidivaricata]
MNLKTKMACSSTLSKPGSLTPKEVSVSFVLESEVRPRSLSASSRTGPRRAGRVRTRTGMLTPRLSPIMSKSDDDCIPGTPIIHGLSEDLESSVSRIKEIQSSVQDSASYSEGFKSFPDNPPQRTVSLKRCFDSQDEKSDTSVGGYDLFDTFNTESVSKVSWNEFSGDANITQPVPDRLD